MDKEFRVFRMTVQPHPIFKDTVGLPRLYYLGIIHGRTPEEALINAKRVYAVTAPLLENVNEEHKDESTFQCQTPPMGRHHWKRTIRSSRAEQG